METLPNPCTTDEIIVAFTPRVVSFGTLEGEEARVVYCCCIGKLVVLKAAALNPRMALVDWLRLTALTRPNCSQLFFT